MSGNAAANSAACLPRRPWRWSPPFARNWSEPASPRTGDRASPRPLDGSPISPGPLGVGYRTSHPESPGGGMANARLDGNRVGLRMPAGLWWSSLRGRASGRDLVVGAFREEQVTAAPGPRIPLEGYRPTDRGSLARSHRPVSDGAGGLSRIPLLRGYRLRGGQFGVVAR